MASYVTLLDLDDWPEFKPILQKAIQQATESLDVLVDSPMLSVYAQEPTAFFPKVESFLTDVYGFCTTEAFKINKPLLDINIIMVQICGYPIQVDNYPFVMIDSEHKTKVGSNTNLLSMNVATSHHSLPLEMSKAHVSHHFEKVAVGGTWDHLHAGHKILLTMTAFISRHEVVCGVTDYDEMAIQKKKFYQKMQPLNQRISKVHHFLEKIKKGLVYEIAPIQDAYGPTRTDAHIQALIGSTETQAGCEAVNDMRKTQALPSLDIFLIRPLILEHQSVKLSSSKIREYLDKKEMSVFFT